MKTTPPSALRPRFRVLRGSDIALGPGKVDVLDAIEETGTLAGAAQHLGMSYMRAWKLVQAMNGCFREPLVETSRGGSGHGHASLTDTGKAVRDLYRRMEADSLKAADPAWKELQGYLAE
ncbi:MAG TPA: LysR family transcriptional regulator [Thermoanaerobaculia bacterium]|nr:LysR family transcriptional regulator [Thermoanaerobaculia bacterium]